MTPKEGKELSEILCVGRFVNKIHFLDIKKNPIEDEVDIFAINKLGEQMKFQIVNADPQFSGEIGKHISARRKGYVEEKLFIRDNSNALNIINPIKSKINLYQKQGKDMHDIILLLDDATGDMPEFLLKTVKEENADILLSSGFKEIWYIGNSSFFKFF